MLRGQRRTGEKSVWKIDEEDSREAMHVFMQLFSHIVQLLSQVDNTVTVVLRVACGPVPGIPDTYMALSHAYGKYF
jgi:hypothetical protein